MNFDVFDEVMVFNGISVKVNDRILYSFNPDLPERFYTHFHTLVAWIQSYLDDFLKGNEIEDLLYKESIHYEIKGDSLILIDDENRFEILTYSTEKTEVKRVIAIGCFEYYHAMV